MFDIGFSKIIVIFGLALVVLGPEKLPRVAATVGRWVVLWVFWVTWTFGVGAAGGAAVDVCVPRLARDIITVIF